MLGVQSLGDDDELVGLVTDLEDSDGVIERNGVVLAHRQAHEGGVVVGKSLELGKRSTQLSLVAALGQKVQGCGVGLRDHVLASKVSKLGDAGIGLHNDNLAVLHVRGGEGVVVLAALNGEAVPDAGDLAGVEQGILSVPGDGLVLDLPALLLTDGGGKVEVEAGVVAVIAHIAVRREILVETNDEGAVKLDLSGLFLLIFSKSQACAECGHGAQGGSGNSELATGHTGLEHVTILSTASSVSAPKHFSLVEYTITQNIGV